MHITFRTVDNNEISRAFDWHRAFAEGNDAIYPRDNNSFANLVYDRTVWCAVTPDDRIQALSYAAFSAADHESGRSGGSWSLRRCAERA